MTAVQLSVNYFKAWYSRAFVFGTQQVLRRGFHLVATLCKSNYYSKKYNYEHFHRLFQSNGFASVHNNRLNIIFKSLKNQESKIFIQLIMVLNTSAWLIDNFRYEVCNVWWKTLSKALVFLKYLLDSFYQLEFVFLEVKIKIHRMPSENVFRKMT